MTADISLKDWQQLSQGLDLIKLTCLACFLTFTNALKSLNHFACGNVMFNQTRSSKMNVAPLIKQSFCLYGGSRAIILVGLEWMEWDLTVITRHRTSKSTLGADNEDVLKSITMQVCLLYNTVHNHSKI